MFNIIKDNPGARRKYKALGRGIGSGKGKTSARGGKGQTARSGVALNGFEGGQMPLIRRLPKRGFNSLNNMVVEVLNFDNVEAFIKSGKLKSNITISDLRSVGLLKGKVSRIKLLGTGELKSKFTIEAHMVSKSAEEKLKKAGCDVKLVKFEFPVTVVKQVQPKQVKEKVSAPKKAVEEVKATKPKAPAKAATGKKAAAPKKAESKEKKTVKTKSKE